MGEFIAAIIGIAWVGGIIWAILFGIYILFNNLILKRSFLEIPTKQYEKTCAIIGIISAIIAIIILENS